GGQGQRTAAQGGGRTDHQGAQGHAADGCVERGAAAVPVHRVAHGQRADGGPNGQRPAAAALADQARKGGTGVGRQGGIVQVGGVAAERQRVAAGEGRGGGTGQDEVVGEGERAGADQRAAVERQRAGAESAGVAGQDTAGAEVGAAGVVVASRQGQEP